MKKFTINGDVWIAPGMQGAWYFVYVGDKESALIRKAHSKNRRGFGAVKIKATCGKTVWTTSIFPTKEGPYVLPIKAKVRKAEGIFEGDTPHIFFTLV